LDNEPHILLSANLPGNPNAEVLAIDGQTKSINKAALQREAPTSPAFLSQYAWHGCPANLVESNSIYKSYSKCARRALKSSKRSWQKALARLQQAPTPSEKNRIQEEVNRKQQSREAKVSSSCGELESRLEGVLRQTYGEIIDHHQEKQYGQEGKRAAIIQDEGSSRLSW